MKYEVANLKLNQNLHIECFFIAPKPLSRGNIPAPFELIIEKNQALQKKHIKLIFTNHFQPTSCLPKKYLGEIFNDLPNIKKCGLAYFHMNPSPYQTLMLKLATQNANEHIESFSEPSKFTANEETTDKDLVSNSDFSTMLELHVLKRNSPYATPNRTHPFAAPAPSASFPSLLDFFNPLGNSKVFGSINSFNSLNPSVSSNPFGTPNSFGCFNSLSSLNPSGTPNSFLSFEAIGLRSCTSSPEMDTSSEEIGKIASMLHDLKPIASFEEFKAQPKAFIEFVSATTFEPLQLGVSDGTIEFCQGEQHKDLIKFIYSTLSK